MAERGDCGAALVYRLPRPLAVPFWTAVPQDDHCSPRTGPRARPVPPSGSLALGLTCVTFTNSSTPCFPAGPPPSRSGVHGQRFPCRPSPPGEEFELQLGVDDRIRVRKRELRRRSTGKTMLGGTRSIDIAYEITVENHRDRVARVSVHDHIPLSRDGDVKVRLRETNPKPNEQDELGELTWELTLDPGRRRRSSSRSPLSIPLASRFSGCKNHITPNRRPKPAPPPMRSGDGPGVSGSGWASSWVVRRKRLNRRARRSKSARRCGRRRSRGGRGSPCGADREI